MQNESLVMMIKDMLDQKMGKVEENIQRLDDKMEWMNAEIRQKEMKREKSIDQFEEQEVQEKRLVYDENNY